MGILASQEVGQSLRIFSNKGHQEDFRIAKAICAHYEVAEPSNTHRFPRGFEKIPLLTKSSLQAWLLYAFDGKAGLDSVPRLIIPNGKPAIQATGHLSVPHLSKNLHNLKRSAQQQLSKENYAKWAKQLNNFLCNPIDFEESGPRSNLMLYLNGYAPNHSGGNWRWLLGGTLRWTPLTSPKYFALHLSALNHGLNPARIQPSLLGACSPELLGWPHNKRASTWSKKLTSSPLFRRKGELVLVSKQVYGFDEIAKGASVGAEHSILDSVEALFEAANSAGHGMPPEILDFKEVKLRELSHLSEVDFRSKMQYENIPGAWVRQAILNQILQES
jgi:hypothetical protein